MNWAWGQYEEIWLNLSQTPRKGERDWKGNMLEEIVAEKLPNLENYKFNDQIV
jgi:hypothetical protein